MTEENTNPPAGERSLALVRAETRAIGGDDPEAHLGEYVGESDEAHAPGEGEQEAAGQAEAEVFPVPDDSLFDAIGAEFYGDPVLDRLGAEVINRYMDHFGFILNFNFGVSFLWKRKGGNSKRRLVLGKCTKPGPMLRHFMRVAEDESGFVIWIAADHARGRLTHKQMEALMFHELKHIGTDEKNNPILRGHDFEGFASEIAIFGAWSSDITVIAQAFQAHEKGAGDETGD